jgi:RND family efflux transporter MFP subunit
VLEDVMSLPDQKPDRSMLRRLRQSGIVFVVIVVLVVASGAIVRAAQDSHLQSVTAEESLPNVSVISPVQVDAASGLDLPGRLQAFISAPIYARVPGYLKSWKYDIGARVKAGDVLAVIDTPDLDQQLAQARAELNVAQANARLAEISAKRWQALAGTDAVAKQDVDQRTYAYNASLAQVQSAQANVDRLVAEEGFKRLVAPFDGVITARNTDIGDLINVGVEGGTALFVVSAINKLRVYVGVPQNDVPKVPPGTMAAITVSERPTKVYHGTVQSSAQAVDPSTDTTLMQIIVDNSDGEMSPGDYAGIHLRVTGSGNLLSVPASAMIFDARGLSVATVDSNNRMVIKHVTIAQDLGPTVELSSGLSPDDHVVVNPPDGANSGDEVRVISNGTSQNGNVD